MERETARRPLKSREANWPRQLAFALVRFGLTPNQISVASVILASLGAFCLFAAGRTNASAMLFLAAAVCIQLRLLCNLLDGLMAVEGGKKTKTGEIFNEFPDRIADVILFICAGYSIFTLPWAIQLGWACAIGAVLTAYVRVFGGSVGLAQDFCGPMAKQQRMAVLTAACIIAAIEVALHQFPYVIFAALVLVLLGELITFVRRTVRIAKLLNAR
jgi:phosphatidylglycerophosphate synthase